MKNLFCATFLLIGGSFALSAQTTVTGKIVDSASGQPLPFVVVTVDGTYNYAQSNESGDFIIRNVTGSSYCLTAKMLGYQAFRNCYALPGNSSVSIAMAPAAIIGEEVVVSSTRAGEHSAMAYSTVTKDEIAQQNFGQDLPYLLNMEPSVVTTSDAGTGIGYTGIRIRGSDATRVNVTINGIPVNDAESQGAYWVDLPDVASSTEDVQVQRGVGTSTNGAGAFGGSVNLRTDDLRERAYGELLLSGGSFNTWRTTAKAGTGLLNNHWAFDTRLSMVKSDGYIDRGSSDLRSWYFSGGYYGKKMTVKAITFSGRERTYQAWNGVPEDSLKTNRTYNSAGEYYDAAGNRRYYKDEVDSYQQDYYQLHFILRGNARWTFNWALHATKGKGFYEQYKPGELLADYGLDTGSATGDIVRRLWLDNWFYGVTYGAQYNNQEKFTLTIGGAANNYEGAHYDEVVFGTNLPSGTMTPFRYDDNFASKSDANIFVKAGYAITKRLDVFVDLQYRNVMYHFTGPDTAGILLPQDASYNFINPKAGLTFRVTDQSFVYASFSVGNREPNRTDFVNSTPQSRPKHESLYDGEAGWKFRSEKFAFEANLYYMHYVNQLVLTGRINDVGAFTRENVAQSYRRGIELVAGWQITKQLNLSANATFSQNRIVNFSEFLDEYDASFSYLGQRETVHSADIAFSPAVIGGAELTWQPVKSLRMALQGKYVSKQYLDNTSSDSRSLDPYFVSNLIIGWTPLKRSGTETSLMEELTFSLMVNNLTNTMYSSNGYTYGYVYDGTPSYFNFYYPQAGINFLGMVSMKF